MNDHSKKLSDQPFEIFKDVQLPRPDAIHDRTFEQIREILEQQSMKDVYIAQHVAFWTFLRTGTIIHVKCFYLSLHTVLTDTTEILSPNPISWRPESMKSRQIRSSWTQGHFQIGGHRFFRLAPPAKGCLPCI